MILRVLESNFQWIACNIEALRRRASYRLPYGSLRVRLTSGTGLLILCIATILLFLLFYSFFGGKEVRPRNGELSAGTEPPLSLEDSNRLQGIVRKADTNKDGLLSEAEISSWINQSVHAHFADAINNNFIHFLDVDNNPRNGLVSWPEYLVYLLQQNGLRGNTILADDVTKKSEAFKSLPKFVRVEIARVEAGWQDAASSSPAFLTVDEYLALQHPEASPTKLLEMVQDVFLTLDLNGDGGITKSELKMAYAEDEAQDPVYRNDAELIDSDGDGIINRAELLKYMDPRNLHHAQKEASRLIGLFDANGDDQLSWAEIKRRGQSVLDSRFYDAGKALHKNA